MQEILHVSAADAQAAYGACIVTFLGAVHWGLAMAKYAGWLPQLIAAVKIHMD